MESIPVLVIEGTTGPAGNLFSGIIYNAIVKSCGTGRSIPLRNGGTGEINHTYDAFAADVDRRLGRSSELPIAIETPAILLGHSQAVPHILKYLTFHPTDRAILVAGPVQGLEYLRPINTFIEFSTMFWLPVARQYLHQLFPMLRDFAPESQFLARVRLNSASYIDRIVVIASTQDWIVPWRSSFIPGARMVLLVGSQEKFIRYSSLGAPLMECVYAPGSGHLAQMAHHVVGEYVSQLIAEVRSDSIRSLHLVSA